MRITKKILQQQLEDITKLYKNAAKERNILLLALRKQAATIEHFKNLLDKHGGFEAEMSEEVSRIYEEVKAE